MRTRKQFNDLLRTVNDEERITLWNGYAKKEGDGMILYPMSEFNNHAAKFNPLEIVERTRKLKTADDYFFINRFGNFESIMTCSFYVPKWETLCNYLYDNKEDFGVIALKSFFSEKDFEGEVSAHLEDMWTCDKRGFIEYHNHVCDCIGEDDSKIYFMEDFEKETANLSKIEVIEKLSSDFSPYDDAFSFDLQYGIVSFKFSDCDPAAMVDPLVEKIFTEDDSFGDSIIENIIH